MNESVILLVYCKDCNDEQEQLCLHNCNYGEQGYKCYGKGLLRREIYDVSTVAKVYCDTCYQEYKLKELQLTCFIHNKSLSISKSILKDQYLEKSMETNIFDPFYQLICRKIFTNHN